MKLLESLAEAARNGATVQVVMSGGQAIEGRLVSASEAGVVVQQPQGNIYIRSEGILMVIDKGYGIDVIPADALRGPGGLVQ